MIVKGRSTLLGTQPTGKLSKIVFGDKQNICKLNSITHPKVLKVVKDRITKASNKKITVVDAALLVESGLLSWVDKLLVVKLKPKLQINRLKKDGFSLDEVKARLSCQSSQNSKIKYADFVIDNSGRRNQTQKQVEDIWNRILKRGR